MKRYWKIAVLAPFILLCIGTYYIHAASVSYPDYYLKLQSGDEKEAAGISLEANYTNQSLIITSAGSEYRNTNLYWNRLNSYVSPTIEKLQKEHRQFMRGKNYPSSFFEDDQTLCYAEILSAFNQRKGEFEHQIKVSIYDKLQKRTSSFKALIQKGNAFQYIRISDVQIVGQTLSLITMNTKEPTSNASYLEIHHYKLDLAKKNIASDQVIINDDYAKAGDSIAINYFPESAFTKPNRYEVFKITHTSKEQKEAASVRNTVDRQELAYYDLESSKLIHLDGKEINDLLINSKQLNISYSQGKLLLTDLEDPKAIKIFLYNLAGNKVESNLTLETNHYLINGRQLSFVVNDKNRLYLMETMVHATGFTPALLVSDLDTGKILYEGSIARKDNEAISNLMIGNIYFK